MNELKQVRDALEALIYCHDSQSERWGQEAIAILDRLSAPVGAKKIEGLEEALKDANKIWTKTSPSLFGGIACKNNKEAEVILQAARAYLELQNAAPTPATKLQKDVNLVDGVSDCKFEAPAPTEIDLEGLKREIFVKLYPNSSYMPEMNHLVSLDNAINFLAAKYDFVRKV